MDTICFYFSTVFYQKGGALIKLFQVYPGGGGEFERGT